MVSKVKIPHLDVLPATTVNKASDWLGQDGRGGAGAERSLFTLENRALEARLLPGDADFRQLGSEMTVRRK